MQFHNVETEQEDEADELNSVAVSESDPVSREDTMVEHSVVINETQQDEEQDADYM